MPIIKDIPLIGSLFGSTSDRESNNQLSGQYHLIKKNWMDEGQSLKLVPHFNRVVRNSFFYYPHDVNHDTKSEVYNLVL